MPTDECQRILSIPRVDYMDATKYPDLSETLMRKEGEWWKKGYRLFPQQNAAIYALVDRQREFEATGKWSAGACGIIQVGGGKTLIALMSGTVLGKRKIVYITRARLRAQVRREVHDLYAPNFKISEDLTVDVHSYSELSAQDASKSADDGVYNGGKLFQWCTEGVEHPGEVLIVLDEVHRLANPGAARTQRFLWDFLTLVSLKDPKYRPALLMLTGSAVRTEVDDMAHMFYMALGRTSPLPVCIPTKHPVLAIDNIRDPSLDGWGNWLNKGATGGCKGSSDMDALIDAFGEPGDEDAELTLDNFGEFFGDGDGADNATVPFSVKLRQCRKALQRRIASCPGIVMPPHDPEQGTKANIVRHYIDDKELVLPDICRRWLDDYRNGRIDEDIYVCDEDNGESRINKTLALGFVNKWIWPDTMDLHDRHEWRVARSEYGKFIRAELAEFTRPGYDTEKKVRDYLLWQIKHEPESRDGAHDILERWLAAVKKWGRHIPTEAEWVDEFLIDDVMERVAAADKRKEPLLVWYRSLGIMEKLRERGMRVWYGDDCDPIGDAGKSVALSANSHTEGLNLQYAWKDNLILELPGSAITQQLMGRTHRTGQEADFVTYSIYTHSPDLKKVLRSVQMSAERDQDLTGDPQKILIGTEE